MKTAAIQVPGARSCGKVEGWGCWRGTTRDFLARAPADPNPAQQRGAAMIEAAARNRQRQRQLRCSGETGRSSRGGQGTDEGMWMCVFDVCTVVLMEPQNVSAPHFALTRRGRCLPQQHTAIDSNRNARPTNIAHAVKCSGQRPWRSISHIQLTTKFIVTISYTFVSSLCNSPPQAVYA